MWSYLCIAIGVTLLTMLMMYIDSRLFDKPKTRTTYVKSILMSNIITFSTIFILMWLSPTKNIKDVVQGGGETIKKITDKSTMYIAELGEDMIAGEAPF